MLNAGCNIVKLKSPGKYIRLIFICLPLVSFAQKDIKLEPVSRTYALTNAFVVQAPGRTISFGTVIIRDGLILDVGKNIQIPREAIIIKADSMYIYPGFIDGLSRVGVDKPDKEANMEKPKDPGNPSPERAGITPAQDVRDYLNPDERSLVDLRSQGFTVAHVVPYGVFLPGKGAVVSLGGESKSEMVMVSDASLYAELTSTKGVYPSTIMGVMAKWRELYRQAAEAKAYQQVYASVRSGLERPVIDPVLEALYPVVEKKLPVVFKAENATDIFRVLTLGKDLGFTLTIAEMKEGWDAIQKIKTSGAKVFLSLDLPEESRPAETKETFEVKEENQVLTEVEKERLEKRKEEYMRKYAGQAASMHANGLKFGFSSMAVKHTDIHANLRKMIAAGLSEDAALAALTTTPAEFFGLADRLGTIDKGKIANIFITNQPYFSEKMKIRYVFVDGDLYECGGKGKKYDKKPITEIDGTWSFTMQAPEGKVNLKIVFKKQGKTYGGYISGGHLPNPIEFKTVTHEGDKLRFTYTAIVESNRLDVTVHGTLEGASFKGRMNFGTFGDFPMEGTKDPRN